MFETFLLTSVTARLLSMTVPILLLASAWVLETPFFKRYTMGLVACSVIFFGTVLAVSPLGFYRLLAPFGAARVDYSQYVVGWPSGWGVKEAIAFLHTENTRRPIVVFTRLDSGNPEDAVHAYMFRYNIPAYYLEDTSWVDQQPSLAASPRYFVSRGPQYAGLQDTLTEVARFNKPLDNEFVGVYRMGK